MHDLCRPPGVKLRTVDEHGLVHLVRGRWCLHWRGVDQVLVVPVDSSETTVKQQGSNRETTVQGRKRGISPVVLPEARSNQHLSTRTHCRWLVVAGCLTARLCPFAWILRPVARFEFLVPASLASRGAWCWPRQSEATMAQGGCLLNARLHHCKSNNRRA